MTEIFMRTYAAALFLIAIALILVAAFSFLLRVPA